MIRHGPSQMARASMTRNNSNSVLRGDRGWLFGDRRQALAEFSSLVEIERSGRP